LIFAGFFQFFHKLINPSFEHFGDTVENLTAIVRRAVRPTVEKRSGQLPRHHAHLFGYTGRHWQHACRCHL
jgi:hypothetical protein